MRFEEISPAEHPDLYLQPRHPLTIADGYWRECSIESNDLPTIHRQARNKIRLARSTQWPLPYVRNVRLEERAGDGWLPMESNDENPLPIASQWRWDPGPEPDGWPNKKN